MENLRKNEYINEIGEYYSSVNIRIIVQKQYISYDRVSFVIYRTLMYYVNFWLIYILIMSDVQFIFLSICGINFNILKYT